MPEPVGPRRQFEGRQIRFDIRDPSQLTRLPTAATDRSPRYDSRHPSRQGQARLSGHHERISPRTAAQLAELTEKRPRAPVLGDCSSPVVRVLCAHRYRQAHHTAGSVGSCRRCTPAPPQPHPCDSQHHERERRGRGNSSEELGANDQISGRGRVHGVPEQV